MENFRNFLIVIIIFSIKDVRGECGPGTATEFVEIPEDQYDTTYVSIEDGDNATRPLGFLKATVKFGTGEENPCVSVSGVLGRGVEIMFESDPPMVLCYRDQTGNEQCEEGRYQECKAAEADTMYYKFFCDVSRGCSESDVNFWYRITKGESTDYDDEAMWCMWRDNLFPEDLIALSLELPEDVAESDATTATPGVTFYILLYCVLLLSLFHTS